MKKYTPSQLLNMFGGPLLTLALGLVLLFSPDTAAALIGKVLAWLGIGLGVVIVISAGREAPSRRPVRYAVAAVLLIVSAWVLLNPLLVAQSFGRILGILILLRGGQDVRLHLHYNKGKFVLTPGMTVALVTSLIGLVLILLPMTTSRLLFTIIGLVLICVGGTEIYDRIRGRTLPEPPDDDNDPNIIDAL